VVAAATYAFSVPPFSPLPTEGEGAGVRGELLARGCHDLRPHADATAQRNVLAKAKFVVYASG